MKIEDVIEKVIFLPKNFYKSGNEKSIYGLLEETGYLNESEVFLEDAVSQILLLYPDQIVFWLKWSENKRSSNGWYFSKGQSGKYIVGQRSIN